MQPITQFRKLSYRELNARAKENFNFHLIAAKLVEYGFARMRLSDDYGGADFISVHIDGEAVLKVQQKGRLTFDPKYDGKGVCIAFREKDEIFVYPHCELRERIQEVERARSSGHSDWWDHGSRSWPAIPKFQKQLLDEYKL